MTVVYLETSVVVSWLLGEPAGKGALSVLEQAEVVVTSVLTLLESERTLVRAETERVIKAAERTKLRGLLAAESHRWMWMELTSAVRARAGETFPVEPVRSLDAIHLATALEFMKIYPDLQVLSHDRRILANLEPLGLSPSHC